MDVFLEYVSSGDDNTNDNTRMLSKCAVQLGSINRQFRSHPLVAYVKAECSWATGELLESYTEEEAEDAIRRGANVNATNAIHHASLYKFAHVLIAHQDFINIDAENTDGITALELACSRNDVEGAVVLLEAMADPNKVKECGCTLLHHAVRDEEYQMMMLLLGFGAYVSAQNDDGNTPLHLAVESDNMEFVDALLTDTYSTHPIDLQLVNAKGESVLYLAVGSDDMVHLLLDVGAVPDTCAMTHAARSGDMMSFDLMMEHAGDIVNIKDMARIARRAGHEDVADGILEWL